MLYVDGERVVRGPYSRNHKGNNVSRKLVLEVPPGYLDFLVKDANGNNVRRRLKKEEFQRKVNFIYNPKGVLKDERE